jgi:3-phosphoshikimate 1-carboxyvinyltransferase
LAGHSPTNPTYATLPVPMTSTTETGPDLKARSPWSSLAGVKSVEISPPKGPVNGQLRIPGSKSFTNRALIIAAAAAGRSKLSGILKSDDSYWCIDTLKKLGVNITVDDDIATIDGVDANWPTKKTDLYIGAAGTTARFLPGTLAAANSGEWILEASERMSQRPIAELVTALRSLGGDLEYLAEGKSFPLRIRGTGLRGGPVTVSGKISSQFLSGILIASPLAREKVSVTVTDGIVQHSYIDMTLNLMRDFGAEVTRDDALTKLEVMPTRYQGRDVNLEADASTSCYFLALAALTAGTIRITNLTYNTKQPDIKMLDVFERMGCTVVRGDTYVELTGTKNLRGGFEISMKEMSDQTMTLAVVACFADAPITITGVEHIRHHESDRIKAISTELGRTGIQVGENKDGLKVFPGRISAARFDSYDDHRMAMSLALIGARVPGVAIEDPGCVSKTCPNFFDELRKLTMH